MAARRRQVKKKNTGVSFGSAWMWFFSGLLSGLLLATLALHQGWINTPASLQITDPLIAEEQGAGIAEADEDLAPASQQYDFFEILQEPADPIDVSELRQAATQEDQRRTQAVSPINPDDTSSSYLLQIASFQSASDADSLKAEVGLLGISAAIVTADIDGNTWHRVRIGPLSNASEADNLHQRLREAGYQVQIYRQ